MAFIIQARGKRFMEYPKDKARKFKLSKYEKKLKDYAEEIGLPSNTEGQMKEVRSHYCGEKVLQLINEAIGKITPSGHTVEKETTDAFITSGRGIEVEFKFREFSLSDVKWKDCKVSPDKVEHLFEVKGWFISIWDDGEFCVWDCGAYQPKQDTKPTKHQKYSSSFDGKTHSEWVFEYMYTFLCDRAIFTGSIRKKCKNIFTITNN